MRKPKLIPTPMNRRDSLRAMVPVALAGAAASQWPRPRPTLMPGYSSGILNVKDFGAVGDGFADDTEAVQNAANLLYGGGVLFFPAGVYVISETIEIPAPGKRILVLGYGAEVRADYPGIMFEYSEGTGTSASLHFEGLFLRNVCHDASEEPLILFQDKINSGLVRCYVQNFNRPAVEFRNHRAWCEAINVKDVYFSDCSCAIYLNKEGGTQSFGYADIDFFTGSAKNGIVLGYNAELYNSRVRIVGAFPDYSRAESGYAIYIMGNSGLRGSDVSVQIEAGKVAWFGGRNAEISGIVHARVGSDIWTDTIRDQRKTLEVSRSRFDFDLNPYVDYPSGAVMRANIHGNLASHVKGLHCTNQEYLYNGWINRNYTPDAYLSMRRGKTEALRGVQPETDTSAAIALPRFGFLRKFEGGTDHCTTYETRQLFPTFDPASNEIPEGTIAGKMYFQPSASDVTNHVWVSHEGQQAFFHFRAYASGQWGVLMSNGHKISVNAHQWALPYQRVVPFLLTWSRDEAFVYWFGFRQGLGGSPRWGNQISFGADGTIGKHQLDGAVFDVAIWHKRLPEAYIEDYFLFQKDFLELDI